MIFSRSVWRWDNLRGWSPQRLAAAKRAVDREQSKVLAQRAEVALFPELMAEIQPAFTTVDERRAAMDMREVHITRQFRDGRARMWRSGRSLFFTLPPHRRAGILRLWQLEIYPLDPAYFAEMVRGYSRPGRSPWTYLRKRRLIWNFQQGRLPRPATFLQITRDWNTL